VLSIQFIRENTDRVKRDVAARNTTAPIDRILELDESRRALLQEVERLRAERNAASKAISVTKDAAERSAKIAATREVGDQIDQLDKGLRAVDDELNSKLLEVPNILDPNVPRGPDERSNVVVETFGRIPEFGFEARPHWELAEIVDGIDFERGVKMSGSRFYVLRGAVARLQRALIQFMLNSHVAAGFEEHYVPYMLSEASLVASGQLPKFRENLYHDDEEDYFFIPTAEVALVNLYRDEILPPSELPKRLVAHTPCFRREKMSAGRDVRGIKRGHQFDKVELVKFVEPSASDTELLALLDDAEDVCRRLEIPHRVVQMCTGDLSFVAAMKYDVELWAPGCAEWLEVSSCSSFRDFQARRANIRYRPAPRAKPELVHTLNGSGLALPRVVIGVLETYQQADGTVRVPGVLQPYMGGRTVIGQA